MFKDITGYDGIYKINKDGVIVKANGDILRHCIDYAGYHKVGLYKEGKLKTVFVHRLVAIEFIDNPCNKKQVHHIDANKDNNNVANLEWVNQAEHSKMHDRSKFKDTYRRGMEIREKIKSSLT